MRHGQQPESTQVNSSPPASPDRPIRLHVIHHPHASLSRIAYALYASAFLGEIVVMFTFGTIIVPEITSLVSASSQLVVLPTSVAIASLLVLPFALAIFAINRFRLRDLRRQRSSRWSRLSRIATRADIGRRLPHRLVEHALFQSNYLTLAIRRCSKSLAPGAVVIVRRPKNPYWGIPRHVDLSFEPISLSDVNQLESLADTLGPNGDANQAESHPVPGESPETTSPDGKKKGKYRIALIVLTPLIPFAYIIYKSATTAISSGSLRMLLPWGVTAGVILVAWMVVIVFESGWWIVPGGLVHRFSHLFQRRSSINLYTSRDTSLVMSGDLSSVFLVRASKVRSPRFTSRTAKPLLIAWLSRAPTPSPDQLRQLLDSGASR